MITRLLMICAAVYSSLAMVADAARVPIAENVRFGCAQPAGVQAVIIREAEANDYSIRRLEFLGNESISDGVLRKRLGALQEGEKFRRRNLVSSLKNVSRLKTLQPVRFSDVMLRLEESDKLVDVVICFREKNK